MNRIARRAAEAEVVIALLAEAYPKTFALRECRRRPLPIGIRTELQVALAGAVESRELGRALRHYTTNRAYLRGLLVGAWRIGLDGRPVGAVTMDEEQQARARLAAPAERTARRKEAATVAAKAAEQPVEPSAGRQAEPSSNLRALIASLREAGRRRREAA